MTKSLKILLPAFALLLALSLVVFLLRNIVILSDVVSAFHPATGVFVKYGLSLLVAAGVFWLAGTLLLRPKALVPPVDPSPEEKARYLARLDSRLKRNKLLRGAAVPAGPEGAQARLAILDQMAEGEIRACARKVFLSTAIAQNGRLDSLIVFVSMAALVWRVSHIYNQRPSLKEMYSIYVNVAGSAFVSYGVDEIDIKSQINALVEPLMAGAAGRLPVVSSVTSALGNAFFHGAVNCILVCRVGLMTKNYLGVGYDPESGLRRTSFRDALVLARGVFKGSFQELGSAIMDVAAAPVEKLKTKTAEAAKSAAGAVGGACGAVASTGRKMGSLLKRNREQ
ncbi:DUF697 domain-containing protein [Fundidesulfovibrio terrae]|uniref:DUF697 domain-containing protein n=1 Tax=Fundidesulfovibrio terrae TaxID=2922866 RepID=UPI001FAECA39|nr:DUF697 domain-containing protein [Fundidesulfovibrio terrae]